MSDAEEDSQMHSSPSSVEDETETMFPSANDPGTPTTHAFQSQAFTSELSPPNSQDPPGQKNGAPMEEDPMDYTSDQPITNRGEQMAMQESGPRMEAADRPGAAWDNPRAHEEYARAMETLVDQNFSLREFGDPFDYSDMQGKG